MKYINRNLEKEIEKMIGKVPVILVTGARQTGKSTLLEYINTISQNKINYVTLDDMIERANAIEDPETFLRSHEAPLIIDEFQYAPNLLSYIKIKVDEARKNEMFGDGKQTGTMYYLTGSQVFQTMKEASESLAGRIGILELNTLSTREIYGKSEECFIPDINLIKQKEKLPYEILEKVFDRILKGSYPALYNGQENDLENFYSSYIKTYIERDIRKLINVKDEIKFLKFISAVAARTAQEYNASEIANDVGIDAKTVDEWLSILKNTFLVYILGPYSNNTTSRAVKRPKIYFMDTGLACYLAGYLDARTLERSAYAGAIFETYVVSEIIKSYNNNGRDTRLHLYYYRDNNQKEIDLLIIDQNNIYPVEIKKSANPGKDAIKNFDVVNKFEMNSPNGIVISLSKDIHALDEKNYIVPIEYL